VTNLRSTVHRRQAVQVTTAALLVIISLMGVHHLNESDRRWTDMVNEGSHDRIEGAGLGSFMFSDSEVIRDNPVRVWYIAPQTDLATAQILFVMPGAERDAECYRSDWEPLVKERNVLVLVPEFPEDVYPVTSYNLGNLVDSDGSARPQEEWTFAVIEALFDQVRRDVQSEAEHYNMFGHSAGAQFVHRFVEFMHPHRLGAAVAANAGWYTVPDGSDDFPYGLDGSQLSVEDLGPAFASELIILLGADDIDAEDDLLRHDEQSDAQGLNRLERGLNFYLAARDTAAAESMPFQWELRVVSGIDHDHTQMAKAAAEFLIDGP